MLNITELQAKAASNDMSIVAVQDGLYQIYSSNHPLGDPCNIDELQNHNHWGLFDGFEDIAGDEPEPGDNIDALIDSKDKVKTFTLYRADVLNPNKSGSIAVFDTTYYLDRDMDWDTQDEYELPKGWRFVDGDDGDFSYLVTDNNQILDGRSISHYKTEDTAGAWYTGKKGATKVLFKKVTDDSI